MLKKTTLKKGLKQKDCFLFKFIDEKVHENFKKDIYLCIKNKDGFHEFEDYEDMFFNRKKYLISALGVNQTTEVWNFYDEQYEDYLIEIV